MDQLAASNIALADTCQEAASWTSDRLPQYFSSRFFFCVQNSRQLLPELQRVLDSRGLSLIFRVPLLCLVCTKNFKSSFLQRHLTMLTNKTRSLNFNQTLDELLGPSKSKSGKFFFEYNLRLGNPLMPMSTVFSCQGNRILLKSTPVGRGKCNVAQNDIKKNKYQLCNLL